MIQFANEHALHSNVSKGESINMAHIYPVLPDEPLYDGYSVLLDGENLPVLVTRCSAMPFNRRWPGHQRQIEQSELCGMVRFWFEGEATLTVTASRDFERAELRPSSRGVELRREGRTLTFTITRPGGYSLELDGYHHNLHIFADAKPVGAPAPGREVLYYGPGRHEAGIVQLHSHQTVVIDEGAVVYGCFHADGCEDIEIVGRGILDNSHNVEKILFEVDELGSGDFDVGNSKREHTIHMLNCKNIRLEGFVIRDSLLYNVGLWGCEDIDIRDLRIVGCWRYNSDGIDFHNCRHGHVQGCFVRTFDDSICYKGHDGWPSYCEDITVEDCVVWCDWDHCLEIGAECCAEHMRRLVFRNIDVIRSLDIALNIGNVDYGTVSDILYEDIRVEYDPVHQKPQLQRSDEAEFQIDPNSRWLPQLMCCAIIFHPEYSENKPERGHIRGVTFRNIRVTAPSMPPNHFSGFDAEHLTEDILIDGLYLNGQRMNSLDKANVTIGDFARNIRLI